MALDGIRNLPREEQIKAAAQYAGVSPSVLDGIWRVESGRGQNMLSSAGAEGHFQIMPEIRATLEKRAGKQFDPYNFTDGLTMAAELMRENMQLSKGDLNTALAIYHGGTDRRNWGPLTRSYPGKVTGVQATLPTVGDSVPFGTGDGRGTEHTEARAAADRGWAGTGDTVAALNARADADKDRKLTDFEKDMVQKARIEAGVVTGTVEGAQAGADAVRDNPSQVADVLIRRDQPEAVAGPKAVSRQTFRDELEDQYEAEFQQGVSSLDKWGSFFDDGVTAATTRAIAALGDAQAPAGWRYIDHAAEYETPDLSFEELSELRSSASPAEVERVQDRIFMRRHNARVQSGLSTVEQLGWGAAAGFSDPINLAAGVGVGEAFNIAGIGARAAIAAGRPGRLLLTSAGEGAVGSIVTDVGLNALGEHRSGGQILTDAAFGALMSGAFGIMGVRDAQAQRLGNEYIQDLAQRNADALVVARRELGEGADESAVQTRAQQIAFERESRWAIASLTDVPSEDRLFPRVDPGDRTPSATGDVPQSSVVFSEGTPDDLMIVHDGAKIVKAELPGVEGSMSVLEGPDKITIASVELDKKFQGQGKGIELYRGVIDKYLAEGKLIESDASVSEAAGHVYDALARRGYTVVKNPEAVVSFGAWVADGEPVFRVTAGPAKAATPPSSTGPLPGSLKAREREAIVKRYGLDTRISDDAERKLVAHALYQSEQVLAKNNIDSARLGTWLKKANLEVTSTTLLSSDSHVAKAVAVLLLENPEGAAGRRATTAAIARAQLFEEYMGTAARQHDMSYQLWLQEQQVGRFAAAVGQAEQRARFQYDLTLEMAHRQMGRTGTKSAAVKAAADALDRSYKRSLDDQRFMGVPGASRLPEGGESGYFHRQWLDTKIRSLDATQREALRTALKDQFVKTAELYDDDFVDELATSFLERIERKAVHSAEQDATLYSSDTADILRDSLKASGLNEEQIAQQLNRFGRGGASHTKGRIDLDLTQTYADGKGGVFRLMDFINQDQDQLLRQYASRSAGEVSLAKYGINGVAGVKMLKEALRVTGADGKTIKAFDQVMAEFLGQRVGDGDPNILTNVRLLTNMTRLGGASFPQMGTYADAMAALGPGAVLDAMGATPRLLAEVRARAAGKLVDNPVIGGLERQGADFGSSDYRIMGLGQIDEHAALSGREAIGRVSHAIRYGSNGVRILSGHRALVAVQTRGIAEQIVQKAWKYIRDGVEDKALADMGITPELSARLRATMDDVVEFDAAGNVKVYDPDRANPEFDADLIAFRNSVVRGAGQLVQREFIGETGKWAHDGMLKFLMQFRTFSLVAHQKQLGRNIAVYGAPRAAMLVAAAASIAIPVHMARVALNASLMSEEAREEYFQQNLQPAVVGRQVMNYVSGLGLLPDVLDLGSGVAQGWANTFGAELPEWAKATGGRTMAQGSLIGGQFAPGVGLLNDYAQLSAGNLNRLRSSVPGGTLPFIAPWLRGAEAQFKDDE